MYHVGRLGSYITRGVYTVSGPFHPFGGAVDIIVVEQPDGSFKSSPWYVRFGKFQGVLKAREKEVTISVNGVDANFHMYLDQRGEAYFLRDVEGEEGEFVSSSSSSDETGENSLKIRRPMKSKSCNYDGATSNLDDQIDTVNGEITPRTRSGRSRIFGLVFGRRSTKKGSFKDGVDADGNGIVRVNSLERAEIAANLLDVKWSTNLSAPKPIKDNGSLSSAANASDGKGDTYRLINDGEIQVDSSLQEDIEESGSCHVQMGNGFQSFDSQEILIEETNVEISSSIIAEQNVETLDGNGIQSSVHSQKSENSDMGLENSKEESEETLYRTSRGLEEVRSCVETLHVTTELLSEDSFIQQAEKKELKILHIESCDSYPQHTNASPRICGQDEVNLQAPLTLSESYTENVIVDPTDSLVEIEPENISSISGFRNPTENEMILVAKGDINELQPFQKSIINVEKLNDDCEVIKVTSAPISESSEEEQFPFSDFNDSKYRESEKVSDMLDDVDKEDRSSSCSPINTYDESSSSHDCFLQKNPLSDTDSLIDNSKIASNAISIHVNTGTEVGRLTGSLPNMWPETDHFGTEDSTCRLSRSLDSNFISMEWQTLSKEKECCTNMEKENQLSLEHSSKTGSLPNMWPETDHFGTEDSTCRLSRSLDSNFISMEWRILSKEKECCTNMEKENQLSLEHSSNGSHLSENAGSGLANPATEISLCRHLLHEGMGAEAASKAFDAEKLDIDKLTFLGPTIVKNDRLVVRIGGHYFPWDAAAPIILGIAAFGREIMFELKGAIPVDRVEKSLVGDLSATNVASSGSWGIWPFRRSRSRKIGQSTPIETRSTDVENVSESNITLDKDKNTASPKVLRKKIRANTPTSEELASLNLKEGSNVITFTFSTAMLGRQKVDARIFLWKWNTRIVISDVDGTITKSDVLGQFMPLVGVDWSQTGVAHLFSSIKENGYQLLFLSARAISQAYITRQFLVNLKQDGKALPDGPVVISPDGLFPSLFREVIRRAPHEFKIACLEDIKALFPSDCNPFYAGFGNRDTDEFSYLKVGIPKGKIFTINPKGEVSVHGRYDTKSYSSLHDLVHGMFPAMTSSEQEDFNSWNFWRLPLPDIDI